jgi:pyruvate/2-oxoglutarate dehydrogenase complex dihydrolipoamide dehydrogenase (E3) component
VPGVDAELVLDVATAADRALAEPTTLGQNVLIVDDTGDYLPLGLADLLSAAGARVEIVTSRPLVGHNAHTMLEAPHVLGRLAAREVELTSGHLLASVEGGAVELVEIWSRRRRTRDGVTTVVLSLGRVPDDDLWTALDGRGADACRIGDALAPRRTVEVIYEAEKVAREL